MYYFNDMKGCVLTGLVFCLITLVGSIISSHFTEILVWGRSCCGKLCGWTVAYRKTSVDGEASDIHIL